MPPLWLTFLKQPFAVVQAGSPYWRLKVAEVALDVRIVVGVHDPDVAVEVAAGSEYAPAN